MKRALLITLAVIACATGRADAYPQWQLSRDVNCASCHRAPDGGGLLTENGLVMAQTVAWLDHEPAFLHGVLGLPDWLQLGGDLRGAAGVVSARESGTALFPMQADLAANVHKGAFSLQALVGFRRPAEEGSALHVLWSREHYVMWKEKPDEGRGYYVRAGRMMPTFGLRLAEHVVYTQRFGGRQLFHEAYAVAVSRVNPHYEVHATGFLHDPFMDSPEHGDGGALYGEARIGPHAAVGLGIKYTNDDDQSRTYAGLTGKLYLPSVDVMLLGEAQLIRQHIDIGDFKTNQLAAYAMASRPMPAGLQLDLGVGHFTQDTRVDGLYRDCVDLNLHWFMTSHIEWLLTTRLEKLGGGGPTAGYALAQLHYRL